MDVQVVVMVLKACLKAAIQDNIPIKDPIFEEHDPVSEKQLIADSLNSLFQMVVGGPDMTRCLNKIVHLNNRFCTLLVYIEKSPEPELSARVEILMAYFLQMKSAMEDVHGGGTIETCIIAENEKHLTNEENIKSYTVC